MLRHNTDFYMDGHTTIEFCTVCSAEGLKLQQPCCGFVEVKPRAKTQSDLDNEYDFIESQK
jgi:hypothetical protein